MDASTEDSNCIYIRNQANLTFKEMWTRNDLSDCILCCDQQVFNVHRFLLAACSPYFRKLFNRKSAQNVKILVKDVRSDDLRRVLQYMYNGSVMIKNEELQAFGELLEMFLMPLPDDMIVSCDSSGNVSDSNDPEQDNDDDTDDDDGGEDEDDDYDDIDEFIPNIQKALEKLTTENITEISSEILHLAKCKTFRLEAIVNSILQLVVKFTPICGSILLGSLVQRICTEDDTHSFQDHMQRKSLQLLDYLLNSVPADSKPCKPYDINGASSLDKEVIRIEIIQYYWNIVRKRRITHFVAQLYSNNLIIYTDIHNLKQSHPTFEWDRIIENNFDASVCCDLKPLPIVQEIMQDKQYECARQIENHLFWLHIENNQDVSFDGSHEFTTLINPPRRRRIRKRKRGNGPQTERQKRSVVNRTQD